MKERLNKLLTVKSLVTLVLTVVFAFLSITGKISSSEFLTIFTVVIGFYFGTQYEKKNNTSSEA
jgi:general stress protein CsbA